MRLLLASTASGMFAPFVSPPRVDAPTDGAPLFLNPWGTFATAIDASGNEIYVDIHAAVGRADGTSISKVLPPAGGWAPNETYTVTVYGWGPPYGFDPPYGALTFTTASTPSPAPHAVAVTDVRVSSWTEPVTPPRSGCCHPLRTIEIDVAAPDADPWAWTAVMPLDHDGGPLHAHESYSDAAVGPGAATLSLVQWFDEERRILWAGCFDVVEVSAAGVEGGRETFCVEDDLPGEAGDERTPIEDSGADAEANGGSDAAACATGCASAGGTLHVGSLVTAAIALVARRRRGAASETTRLA